MRVRLKAHQFARDIGVEQIHGSIESGRGRAGFMMPFILNLIEDLKNRIIVGYPVGIVKRPVRQPLKMTALGAGEGILPPCQSIAHGLLLGNRQAFHEFNDVQRNGAHGETFAEFSRGVKRLESVTARSAVAIRIAFCSFPLGQDFRPDSIRPMSGRLGPDPKLAMVNQRGSERQAGKRSGRVRVQEAGVNGR